MLVRFALLGLTLLGVAAACGEVSTNSGPPVAGTTPSTFNPLRQEAATITQQSQGLGVR